MSVMSIIKTHIGLLEPYLGLWPWVRFSPGRVYWLHSVGVPSNISPYSLASARKRRLFSKLTGAVRIP